MSALNAEDGKSRKPKPNCPFCGRPLQKEQDTYYSWVWTCRECKVVVLKMKVEWV